MDKTSPSSGAVRTLMQAHEALAAEMPVRGAPVERWREFYRRSAAVYAEVAEIDRGHHHEALYWAHREQLKADELDRFRLPR